MAAKQTPMLKQYHRLKAEHPDMVMMFRMGDFYEMFYDDAVTASEVLGITLTSRGAGGGKKMPLAGIPWHQLDAYLSKFVRAGYKVAIAEQTEDPKKTKGIVKRDVVRVATPGTVTESSILDDKRHNYIVSLFRDTRARRKNAAPDTWGVAVADLSTGQFEITEIDPANSGVDLMSELWRLQPAEVVVPESLREEARAMTSDGFEAPITALPDDDFGDELTLDRITEQLGVHDLSGFGAEELSLAQRAAGALIGYLRETQRSAIEHVNALQVYSTSDYMILDSTTQRSLELAENLHGAGRDGTLLSVLDRTVTPMGGRLLRSWLLQPLKDAASIECRLGAVAAFVDDMGALSTAQSALKNVYDIERIVARVNAGGANARDLVSLRSSLSTVPELEFILSKLDADLWRDMSGTLDPHADLCDELARGVEDQPPMTIREGGLIRDGFDETVDELRSLMRDSKSWIAQMREAEIARTGADKLKIGFNKVFGYYIEISQAALRDIEVPETYIRKQTLVNAERYITPELKEREEAILTAEERLNDREYELFTKLLRRVAGETRSLQALAKTVAMVDAIASLAETALSEHYARPTITEDGALDIKDGRHPVLETLNFDQPFVPNDALLNGDSEQILLITGPNMAGKSTYIRQVALITLMAHVGSFVPAREASICLVDRIFTRVGAMDALAKGQSTFLVEMSETANILNNATNNSLVILDEIGRGTSTYDGLSIAWSVVEYLHNQVGCNPKTLFATHYHQLVDLEGVLPRVKNYNVAVDESGDHITFLYRIVRGGADRSYGIYAAQLAGIPATAVERAKEVLLDLEMGNAINIQSRADRDVEDGGSVQLTFFDSAPEPIVEKLRAIDVNNLTPMQALALIDELAREAR